MRATVLSDLRTKYFKLDVKLEHTMATDFKAKNLSESKINSKIKLHYFSKMAIFHIFLPSSYFFLSASDVRSSPHRGLMVIAMRFSMISLGRMVGGTGVELGVTSERERCHNNYSNNHSSGNT